MAREAEGVCAKGVPERGWSKRGSREGEDGRWVGEFGGNGYEG